MRIINISTGYGTSVAPTAETITATNIVVGQGSTATPSIGFTGATNTGFYYQGAAVRFLIGGTEIFQYYNAGIFMSAASGMRIFIADGTVTAPALTFAGGSTNGFYRTGSSSFRAVAGGVGMFQWSSAQNIVVGISGTPFYIKGGIDNSTGLRFQVDSGVASIVNENNAAINFGTNNVTTLTLSSAGILSVLEQTYAIGQTQVRAQSYWNGYGAGFSAWTSPQGTSAVMMGKICWDGDESYTTDVATQSARVGIFCQVDGTSRERYRISSTSTGHTWYTNGGTALMSVDNDGRMVLGVSGASAVYHAVWGHGIGFYSSVSGAEVALYRGVTDGAMGLYGGGSYTTGATIIVYGSTASGWANAFRIRGASGADVMYGSTGSISMNPPLYIYGGADTSRLFLVSTSTTTGSRIEFQNSDNTKSMQIGCIFGASNERFFIAGSSTWFSIYRTTGDIVMSPGSALAAGASTGFVYIRNIGGAPSATPSAYTGGTAITFDPATNKLWMHNGTAWKSVTLA